MSTKLDQDDMDSKTPVVDPQDYQIIAEGISAFLGETDMGQADRTLRQSPKEGPKQDMAADGKPLSHSVAYDLTNKKVVGRRHLSPNERVEGGPSHERTFELPLDKSKYDQAVAAVTKKHGTTAAGAKVAHDLFLAYSRAKDKVLKSESLQESSGPIDFSDVDSKGNRPTDNNMEKEHRARRYKEFVGLESMPFFSDKLHAKRHEVLKKLRVRDNHHAMKEKQVGESAETLTEAKLKMKPEHYQELKKRISGFADKIPSHVEAVRKSGKFKDLGTRVRFDVLAATKMHQDHDLYADGVNDDHIDSALKSAFKELKIKDS